MASPDWQHEVLSPEYRADVSPGLPAAYVHVSDNGLGVGQANLRSYPGQDRCREPFTVGHGRDVLGLQPGLVRAEYPIGETPNLQPPSSYEG